MPPPPYDHRPPTVTAIRDKRPTSYISSFIRWLQIKNYQYEVTFSLYMLTRTEKIVFNIIIITLFSLLVIATSLYLPEHLQVICNRIWYYVHGEKLWTSSPVTEVVKSTLASRTASIVKETVDSLRRGAGEL